MTVEVATTIAGLNETYPLATDPKSEGDDHIRLIKAVLKTNLSNVNNTSDANKPVSTATQTALDAKVTGPASTTDNTIARYDGATGKVIQSSSATLDDAGNLSVAGATFSGNVTVGGGTLGYGAGSGGTVTQVTSKSTAVTLNKPSGQITMNNAALAAGASVDFQVNNTTVNGSTGDVIALTGGAFSWNYRIEAFEAGAAYFKVRVTNITGSSLSEAVAINFTVIKGSTT